jgi:outer membrane autotransporter protein
MKKMILVAALMAAFSAQAVELGINASRDTASSDRNGYGFTVGQKFDKVGITAGFDKYTTGTELSKYTLVGFYDVTKVGAATLAVKGGVAYLDQKNTTDGYAALVGVGVSYPLSKQVALIADYRYQVGQSSVNSLDGGTVAAGLKYAF